MKLVVLGLMLAGSLIVVAQQRMPDGSMRPEDRIRTMQRQMTLLDRPIGAKPDGPQEAGYSADSVKREGGLVRLNGNVRIVTSTFLLTADSAEYRTATGEIEPHGNVRVRIIQQPAKKFRLMP